MQNAGSLKPYLWPFLRSLAGAVIAFGTFLVLLSYLPNETHTGSAATPDPCINPRFICGAAASLGAVISGFWQVFTGGAEFSRPMVAGTAATLAVVTILCIAL